MHAFMSNENKRLYIEDEVSTNKNERPKLGFGETMEIVQSRRSTTTTLNSHSLSPWHLHCSFDICIFALDTWFNQACVGENETCGCSNEPEQGHEWRGEPQERDANHEEPCVEGLLGDELPIDFLKTVDDGKASKEEDEGQEEEGTCDNGIYCKSSYDESVVPREIPSVICESRYSRVEICRS